MIGFPLNTPMRAATYARHRLAGLSMDEAEIETVRDTVTYFFWQMAFPHSWVLSYSKGVGRFWIMFGDASPLNVHTVDSTKDFDWDALRDLVRQMDRAKWKKEQNETQGSGFHVGTEVPGGVDNKPAVPRRRSAPR